MQHDKAEILRGIAKISALASAQFDFERPRTILKNDSADLDGLMPTSNGHYRLAYDEEHKSVVLLYSPNPEHLKAQKDSDNNARPISEELEKCTIVAARRLQTGGPYISPEMANFFREAIGNHDRYIKQRTEDLLTLKAAETRTSIFYTNGWLALEINKETNHVYFHAPSRQRKGKFIPVFEEGKWLSANSVSIKIAEASSLEEAEAKIESYWQTLAGQIARGENIYNNKGIRFQFNRFATAVRNIPDSGNTRHLINAALFASLYYGTKEFLHRIGHDDGHSLTALGISLAAPVLYHAVAHTLFEDIGFSLKKVSKRRTQEKLERDSDQYGDLDDMRAFYLKLKQKNRALPMEPKIDTTKLTAQNVRFLNSDEIIDVLPAHTEYDTHTDTTTHFELIVSADQSGIASRKMQLDKNTTLNIFENGLVRLMHRRLDGKVDVLAKYDERHLKNPEKAMPEAHISQINKHAGKILYFTYDKHCSSYEEAFGKSSWIPESHLETSARRELFRETGTVENVVPPKTGEVIDQSLSILIGAFLSDSEESIHPTHTAPSINAV